MEITWENNSLYHRMSMTALIMLQFNEKKTIYCRLVPSKYGDWHKFNIAQNRKLFASHAPHQHFFFFNIFIFLFKQMQTMIIVPEMMFIIGEVSSIQVKFISPISLKITTNTSNNQFICFGFVCDIFAWICILKTGMMTLINNHNDRPDCIYFSKFNDLEKINFKLEMSYTNKVFKALHLICLAIRFTLPQTTVNSSNKWCSN